MSRCSKRRKDAVSPTGPMFSRGNHYVTLSQPLDALVPARESSMKMNNNTPLIIYKLLLIVKRLPYCDMIEAENFMPAKHAEPKIRGCL